MLHLILLRNKLLCFPMSRNNFYKLLFYCTVVRHGVAHIVYTTSPTRKYLTALENFPPVKCTSLLCHCDDYVCNKLRIIAKVWMSLNICMLNSVSLPIAVAKMPQCKQWPKVAASIMF